MFVIVGNHGSEMTAAIVLLHIVSDDLLFNCPKPCCDLESLVCVLADIGSDLHPCLSTQIFDQSIGFTATLNRLNGRKDVGGVQCSMDDSVNEFMVRSVQLGDLLALFAR